jgi:hypothetical protein
MRKIWNFHAGDYEVRRILGCYAAWLLLRIDFSEERIASIIRVTRIGRLGTMVAITRNESKLRRNRDATFLRNRRVLQEPHGVTSQKMAFFSENSWFLVWLCRAPIWKRRMAIRNYSIPLIWYPEWVLNILPLPSPSDFLNASSAKRDHFNKHDIIWTARL